MDHMISPLLEIQEYGDLLKRIKKYDKPIKLTGPSESQKAHICYAVCAHSGKKGIYVAYNEMQARRCFEDFSYFLGDKALLFSSKEIVLHNVEAKSHEDVLSRIGALDRVLRGDYEILVVSAEAAAHILVPPEFFKENVVEIEPSCVIDRDQLVRKLLDIGYERVDTVYSIGQFAVRGGIIDIYPTGSDAAVRIELFGDEVDSLRQLDTETQRSVGGLEKVRIIPAREIFYTLDRQQEITAKIKHDMKSLEKLSPELKKNIESDIEQMAEDQYFPGADKFISYIVSRPVCIADYTDEDTLVFIDEQVRVKQRLDNLILEHYELCKGMIEKNRLLPGGVNAYFDAGELLERFEKRHAIYLSAMGDSTGSDFHIPGKLTDSYQGHIDILTESILVWKAKKSRVVILSGTRGRGERLCDNLRDLAGDITYTDKVSAALLPGQVVITHGSLKKGFEYADINFIVVSDKEVFGQDRKPPKGTRKSKGVGIDLFTDLKPGDYVVHEAHGIGLYEGVDNLVVEGKKRDYLKIRYQDNGYLYIPVNQLDLIQKYIGSEGNNPKINKLGGTEWFKAKSRVKESIRELAAELVQLYAKRQATQGYKFSQDTVWQTQFEEQFEYEETEDQLRCINDIKEDMESGKLMDRLLCGDVGFGKTEVALRAIFKAVMDGKQVAYLVPTTVLAQQQYSNFTQRMRDFPVTVEMISRFRSPSQQKKIIKDLKTGNVDVLIGTHRLLQKDINFKDLGLLVVDEEQRFGVTHKEKIKTLSPDVDVLTLTATPIPRTLHMSLTGLKDISVIEDPPEERYPVQTFVMEYSLEVAADAIARELGRNGQVFYLYNRVRTIDLKAAELQRLVPEARIAVAHGQMGEKMLEDIMLGFIKGEYDVLVCTTIIESGLDMPNVNTIIVEDADKMGLAQLYQIRGRVGRSNRLAYAYITYKKDKIVNEIAEKRLQAIKEFTDLGSGFKIAMRDMEIRGAGNLLGPQQHGHMESVGYDMYCRLLEEAVAELRGVPARKVQEDVTVDISVNAYIDNEYIKQETRKIEMYKKIAAIRNEQDVLEVQDELIDRYGDLPLSVRNLISISYIRSLASQIGFSTVSEKKDAVVFQMRDAKSLSMEAIGKLAAKYKRQVLFSAGTSPYVAYKSHGLDGERLLDNIKIVLQDLKTFEVQ